MIPEHCVRVIALIPNVLAPLRSTEIPHSHGLFEIEEQKDYRSFLVVFLSILFMFDTIAVSAKNDNLACGIRVQHKDSTLHFENLKPCSI